MPSLHGGSLEITLTVPLFKSNRADVFGNIVRWSEEYWEERNLDVEYLQTFTLCSSEEEGPRLVF